jgi:hypothetical protein
MLAKSESANRPIRAKLAESLLEAFPVPDMTMPDLQAIHKAEPAALKACTEILGE